MMAAGTSEKDVPCAFCGASVVGAHFVLCPQCEVPAHLDCWNANGRCPAYGCGAIDPIDPAIALYRRPRPQTLPAPPAQVAVAVRTSGPRDLEARIQALESRLGQISRVELRKVIPLGTAAALVLSGAFMLPYGIGALVAATGMVALMSWGIRSSHGHTQMVKAINARLDVLRAQQIEQTIESESMSAESASLPTARTPAPQIAARPSRGDDPPPDLR